MKGETREKIRRFTIHTLKEHGCHNYETGMNYYEIVDEIMAAKPETLGRLNAGHIKLARYNPYRLGKILVKPRNVESENRYLPGLRNFQTRYYLTDEVNGK